MSDKRDTRGGSRKQSRRKPYSKPVLQTYGAIRVITENVGSMTVLDNGSPPKTKTA